MPPAAPAPHHADVLGPLRTLLLAVWAASSFGVMYFAHSLQRWVGDWPLTYLLAAQGIVVGFVVLVTVYAWLANRAQPSEDERDDAMDEHHLDSSLVSNVTL
jgi:putative solute:sodium symporter small subunit